MSKKCGVRSIACGLIAVVLWNAGDVAEASLLLQTPYTIPGIARRSFLRNQELMREETQAISAQLTSGIRDMLEAPRTRPFWYRQFLLWLDGKRVLQVPDASVIDVVGDVDGWLDRFKEIIFHGGWIDGHGRWVASEGRFIQAGDALGRGQQSEAMFDYLRALQKEAQSRGAGFERLFGNHEWWIYRGSPLPGDAERLTYNALERLQKSMKEDILNGTLKIATVAGGKLISHAGLSYVAEEHLLHEMGVETATVEAKADFLNQIAIDHAKGRPVSREKMALLEDPGTGVLTWVSKSHSEFALMVEQVMAHITGDRIRLHDEKGFVINTDLGIHKGRLGFLRMRLNEDPAELPHVYAIHMRQDELPDVQELLSFKGEVNPIDGGRRWSDPFFEFYPLLETSIDWLLARTLIHFTVGVHRRGFRHVQRAA